jgi:hypothetical protein
MTMGFLEVLAALAGLALAGTAIYWMFQRGFWILALGVGGLAACFATLASIIHFQILGALVFFALMAACWFGMMLMMEDGSRR